MAVVLPVWGGSNWNIGQVVSANWAGAGGAAATRIASDVNSVRSLGTRIVSSSEWYLPIAEHPPRRACRSTAVPKAAIPLPDARAAHLASVVACPFSEDSLTGDELCRGWRNRSLFRGGNCCSAP